MPYFKIQYQDGTFKIEKSKSALDIIKKHDLCTREHVNTRIVELSGEQLAIAISNERE
jgi:hypothetical protein